MGDHFEGKVLWLIQACTGTRLSTAILLCAAFVPTIWAAAPTKLNAIPGSGMVTLVWKKSTGSTTYNVYRSTTSGNTGTTPLATGLVAYKDTTAASAIDSMLLADYADKSVTNGTTYYYQVASVTGGTESAKSAQVSAQPQVSSGTISTTGFLKIMPLGNSITSGWCSDWGGYRPTLYDSLKAGGYNFLLVGSYTYFSDNMWDQPAYQRTTYNDPYHEGYNNKYIQGLLHGVVPHALPTHDPDIALLEIGTNNYAWSNPDEALPLGAPKVFDSLVTRIFTLKPNIFLLVAPILPTFSDKMAGVTAYNTHEKAVVDSLAKQGKHIAYVSEMGTIVYGGLCDGVHPTQATYDKMGGIWYRAIKSITGTSTASFRPASAAIAAPSAFRIEAAKGRIVVRAVDVPGATIRLLNLRGGVVTNGIRADGLATTVPLSMGMYVVELRSSGHALTHSTVCVP